VAQDDYRLLYFSAVQSPDVSDSRRQLSLSTMPATQGSTPRSGGWSVWQFLLRSYKITVPIRLEPRRVTGHGRQLS
jgi:hypothetical protein